MDPKHSGDMLKHLEKQNELLMDAYRSMSHELHKLQVEEEMLMRKYYEFMEAQGLIDKVCLVPHPPPPNGIPTSRGILIYASYC
ncbi:UNVERIFIED_CONTAM: hypothetical protein Sradi_3095200 [Sesamum radiatum]|uniref:Uncharacterized protein n=1 Tax=Sesamum radiatum TaxID=300843 RepID=A0AAW2RCH5_SESRA